MRIKSFLFVVVLLLLGWVLLRSPQPVSAQYACESIPGQWCDADCSMDCSGSGSCGGGGWDCCRACPPSPTPTPPGPTPTQASGQPCVALPCLPGSCPAGKVEVNGTCPQGSSYSCCVNAPTPTASPIPTPSACGTGGSFCSPEPCEFVPACYSNRTCGGGWDCCINCSALTPTPINTLIPTPTYAINDCYCSLGSCADPASNGASSWCWEDQPALGYESCGTGGCASDRKPYVSMCHKSNGQDIECGQQCIYDAVCASGYCTGDDCEYQQGSFLCGDAGCGGCDRWVSETRCQGDSDPPLEQCQVTCRFDASCGVGCGGVGGPTAAPTIPGGGPTPTPFGGVTPTPFGGVTSTPGLPPTPIPTSTPGGICDSDGLCELGETCLNCPQDCACFGTPTPTPEPGNINVRAMQISPSDTTCAAVAAGTGLDGTVHQFSAAPPPYPPPQTQTGAGYVLFANLVPGSYVLDPQLADPNLVLSVSCINGNPNSFGLATNLAAAQTANWDLGYRLGAGWVQTEGGDVFAASQLQALLPSGISPRVFSRYGPGGSPGVVLYGSGYDFDVDVTSRGEQLVSGQPPKDEATDEDWLTYQTFPAINYYDVFYNRFGGAPVTADYTNPASPVTQPASRATPYYVEGNMTTSGNWNVGNGERVVFIVNGNLTIGGRINLTGSGFVAFIVNGDIRVESTVGTTVASETPVVEGIYITAIGRTFYTGATTAAATAKLVGEGMFISGNFNLERDLDQAVPGQNVNYPAELFIYNPRLLLTMPEEMMDVPISWEEVAP